MARAVVLAAWVLGLAGSAMAAAPVGVSVQSLQQLDHAAGLAWFGRGVQQATEVALFRDADVRVIEDGGKVGGEVVLGGTYEVIGQDVRVNMIVRDGDGARLAAWSMTGSVNELMQLQDNCADRAARSVRAAVYRRGAAMSADSPALSREDAAAAIGWVTSPRVSVFKPVAGQADPRPYDERWDLYHYHYFYQYPTWGCWGCYGWYGGCYGGCGGPFFGGCGGPQATVGFATGGYTGGS